MHCFFRYGICLRFFAVFVILQCIQCFAGQRIEHEDVEDGHKTDTDVAEIPYEGVGCEAADEEHSESNDLIDGLPAPGIAEDIGDIRAGVEQNTDKGRETEEEQDRCNEDCSEVSEMVVDRCLQEVHADLAFGDGLRSQQKNEGGAAADDDGIDEDTQGLYEAHLCRMLYADRCGSAGSRAAACLIGEQTAFDACHEHGTEASCGNLLEAEGLGEDVRKNIGDSRDIDEDQNNGHTEIADSHERNDDIKHRDRKILAKDDDCGEKDQCNRRVKRRDAEGIRKGGGYGITDDLADTAPADKSRECEKKSDNRIADRMSCLLFKIIMNVVGRTTAEASVKRILCLMQLGKRCFDKCRGGA